MASTSQCQYCGAPVQSNQASCPKCGAPNPNYVPDTKRTVFLPKTIDELKEYCAERGMPLLRMRFFIGEDFREPKAFGIYQEGDQFIVYKNKADGSRAIRYQGPDEAFAVNEIFAKLLEECHNRGIYPDGKPVSGSGGIKGSLGDKTGKYSTAKKIFILVMVILFISQFIMSVRSDIRHRHDGYYRFDDYTYYNYGSSWYYDNGSSWVEADSAPVSDYGDYYAGTDYDSDWGGSDFKDSSVWEEIRESNSSSSSDYSSWDSGSTNWDSDW